MASSSRNRRVARSRTQVLRQATAGVVCRVESLERRCLLAADTGVIQGVAFADESGNGELDGGDVLLPSILVFADENDNGIREFDEAATMTNEVGEYSLQLNFGTFVLRYQPQEKDGTLEGPEDFKFEITSREAQRHDLLFRRRLDWGDAPDGVTAPGYPTLAANGGARHLALKGYSLGNRIDPEPDGQPNASATGDDLAGDDEDGVTFLSPLTIGSPANVQVDFTSVMGLTGVLDAWMDFNADRDWDDPGERIFSGQVLAPGANLLSFVVPAGSTSGPTFARFRLSPNGVAESKGTGIGTEDPLHGEVEDYQVRLEGGKEQQLDWGDAPEVDANGNVLYPTRAINNGARHELQTNFTLGGRVDAEADGQPTAGADGDDLSAGDDEDGVFFIDPLIPGTSAKLEVALNPAAGVEGFLDAWIDFNGDGSWAGAGEHVFVDQVLVPGVNPLVVNVPASAKAGPTYARFRLAQQPGAVTSFVGFGHRGEVEDYNPRIVPPDPQSGELDWGDAPAIPGTILQYPTLASQNGARHRIVDRFMLGGKIDPEADGQPTILSDGDDANVSDDEDGVTFLDPLIPGSPARIQVDLLSPTGQGRLDAWIDWHGDGTWNQAIDRIATSAPLVNGPNIIVVNVPSSAMTGRTYSRFRLSFNGGLSFDNFGFEGEVEDHLVEIRNPTNRRLDWGDAPERNAAGAPTAYPTTAANNGARHVVRPGFHLGAGIDVETDGQPTAAADGDDLNGFDDENGVNFITPVIPGGVAQVQVVAPMGGILDAWIDFAGNGNWSDAVDRIATTHPLAPGVNVLNVNVPAGSTLGETYARFRLSPNGVASYDGFGFDGEVEDYRIRIQPQGGDDPQVGPLDWGDAPASYRTLALHDGARHTPRAGFTLGNLVDAEPDGQPSVGANRDDFVGIDDEDGVTIAAGHLVAGASNQFTVAVPGGGVIDAWIDINADGDWADAGEKIFSGVALGPGVHVLNWTAPVSLATGDTYARFRLSPNGVPNYFGFGFEGEVEDYVFKVRPPDQPPPNEGLDWGDAPDNVNGTLYPTLAVNDGARHSHVPGFTLGYRWDSEPDGQPSVDALRDDFNGVDDEDGVKFLSPLIPGQVAKIEVFAQNGGVLDAWIDWDGNGNWTGANDQIFDDQPLVAGSNLFLVPVPAGLKSDPYRTFSRFRLSREGVVDFKGHGGDGEVEDYRNIIHGATVTFEPVGGLVAVVGTAKNDTVFISADPQSDMVHIVIGDPNNDPDEFLLPASEIREIKLVLGDGNDHASVDGADFLAWQRNFGTFNIDGGGGFDSFTVDAAADELGINYIVTPSMVSLIGPNMIIIPSDLKYVGVEELAIQSGSGNDQFLLPAVQGPGDAIREVALAGGMGDDQIYVIGNLWNSVHVDGGGQSAGGPGDSLNIVGAGAGGGPHFEYTPAPGAPDAGSIVGFNPQPEPPAMIHFTGLEPVSIASADVTLTLPPGVNGNDVITIDPLALDVGDSNMISGTSNGSAFEHLVITDVGTFTLDVAANGGSADVVNFNGSIIGAADFTMPAGLADLELNVNAGAIPINWDPGALGASAAVNVATGAEVAFEADQHLKLLSIASGAYAAVQPGGAHLLALGSLDLDAKGTLDLADNDMLIYSGDIGAANAVGTYNGLTGLIQSAYNFTQWNKPGLTTSMADAQSGLTTIGLARASGIFGISGNQTAMWNGETVFADTILVKYTYAGDANLDGQIDAGDYGIIDNFVQISGASGYGNGDFNLDGFIDAGDYGIIDNNIQAQGSPLGSSMTAAAVEESTAAMLPSPDGRSSPAAMASVKRGSRFGSESWMITTAARFGFDHPASPLSPEDDAVIAPFV